jgi:antitoxin VapB
MVTAKLFKNGQSQAVRLPKQYAFQGTEVFVKRVAGVVMLMQKNRDPWTQFINSLEQFSDDFMARRPPQGMTDARDSLK